MRLLIATTRACCRPNHHLVVAVSRRSAGRAIPTHKRCGGCTSWPGGSHRSFPQVACATGPPEGRPWGSSGTGDSSRGTMIWTFASSTRWGDLIWTHVSWSSSFDCKLLRQMLRVIHYLKYLTKLSQLPYLLHLILIFWRGMTSSDRYRYLCNFHGKIQAQSPGVEADSHLFRPPTP